MDDKKSVGTIIEEESKKLGLSFEVANFVRYEVGDGLEKRVENFAEEVAAQMK